MKENQIVVHHQASGGQAQINVRLENYRKHACGSDTDDC